MSRFGFNGRRVLVALLLLAAAVAPGAARAAERTVVLEHWTNFR
jgi:hypothetical protein